MGIEKKELCVYKLNSYHFDQWIPKVSDYENRLIKAGVDSAEVAAELGLDKELFTLIRNQEARNEKRNRQMLYGRHFTVHVYYESISECFILSREEIGIPVAAELPPPPYSAEEWTERIKEEINRHLLEPENMSESEWHITGAQDELLYDPDPRMIEIVKTDDESDTIYICRVRAKKVNENGSKNEIKPSRAGIINGQEICSVLWDVDQRNANRQKGLVTDADRKYRERLNEKREQCADYIGHRYDIVVGTEELKEWFHRALHPDPRDFEGGRREVLISCPWLGYKSDFMGVKTFMDYRIREYESECCVRDMLRGLLNNGVTVKIIFGYKDKNERERKSVDAVYQVLKNDPLRRFFGNKLLLYFRFGNHQKMILRGDNLMIVGSYNYLSNEPADFTERGYITKNKAIIRNEWARVDREMKAGEGAPFRINHETDLGVVKIMMDYDYRPLFYDRDYDYDEYADEYDDC